MRRRRSSSIIHDREIEVAGQDLKKVKQLAARLQRLANECSELGITIFGGSGSGSLRAFDGNKYRGMHDRMLILAQIDGPFDGGDGGASDDDEGLLRGEGI